MKHFHFCKSSLAFSTALIMFAACSQTVEAPDQDDESQELSEDDSDVLKNYSNSGNSTKSSGNTTTLEDLFNSDNIEVTGSSTLSFTGEKVECDFDVDDKEWTIEVEEDNGIGKSIVTFDDKSMKIKVYGSQEDTSATSCEASLAVAQLVLEFSGMQDLDMSCDGKTMNFSGTIIDSTRSAADKKDVYNEICL